MSGNQLRREHICFTCQEAWTPNHKCEVKEDIEADETTKIIEKQEKERDSSQLIKKVEGAMVEQESHEEHSNLHD